MSLINKMLQDLDSRGTPAGEGFSAQVRPVARTPGGRRTHPVALAVAGAIAVMAAAGFAWTHWAAQPHDPLPAKAAAPLAATKPAGMTSTITMAPPAPVASVPVASVPPAAAAAVPASAAPAAPAGVAAASEEPAAAPRPHEDVVAQPDRTPRAQPHNAPHTRASAPAATPPAAPPLAPITAAPMEPGSEEARAARAAILQLLAARASAPLPKDAHTRPGAAEERVPPKGRLAAQGREETGAQRAESTYRAALASLQAGRTEEAIDTLQQALKDNPAHEAARQTLVGLLIEAKRTDEAMRQLQLGLTLDARQPALAMLLARLQIERGGSGLDTLTRTLPYAGNDADYHAFMAAALARQQRHREAAEQYGQAVRTAPSNGVWWMGLGISLEADKRNGEALEAFQKARASGNLSAELAAFVERRIQQLGR